MRALILIFSESSAPQKRGAQRKHRMQLWSHATNGVWMLWLEAIPSNSSKFDISELLLDIVVTVGLRLWCWGFKLLLLLTICVHAFCLTCKCPLL